MSFSPSDLGDDFVDAWSDSEHGPHSPVGPTTASPGPAQSGAFAGWLDKSSGKNSNPPIYMTDILRKAYPNHSIVLSSDGMLNLTRFPHAVAVPMPTDPLITQLQYVPLARSAGPEPGAIVDKVEYGAFRLAWQTYDFIVYVMSYPFGFGVRTTTAVLHEGTETPSRDLIRAAGLWAYEAHEEIWVFDSGFWSKNARLYSEVQKANWKDVILKDEFKKMIKKDVYGFFDSEAIYKELAIPWKRGIVMYGPPGNGKTISLKAIMKECGDKGFLPLYVRSFRSYKGEEGAMTDVFDKARQLAPCVVILEDLDSLVNDSNRSFFLNQLDGLESNDGMLIIGTTNHLDKIDSSLTNRPSRFDRKFLFDDPDADERFLYCQYWQRKLESNKRLDFPDSLAKDIAERTSKFSFAYLKEVFVSSLVVLAGWEGDDRPTFEHVVKDQIAALRKELDKSHFAGHSATAGGSSNSRSITSASSASGDANDIRALFDALCESMPVTDNLPRRLFDAHTAARQTANEQGNELPSDGRDVRALLDRLAERSENRRPLEARDIFGELRTLFEEAAIVGRRNADRIFVTEEVTGPGAQPVNGSDAQPGNGPEPLRLSQLFGGSGTQPITGPAHSSYAPAYLHPNDFGTQATAVPGAWDSRSSSDTSLNKRD
ncbi:P-loop containing nucleoside triphosphate hydrolase protein [Schizophyllum amplum]|uniref:P-loop containing nucleoside triphosphate hydrolase protein n=1 Tax=Schizophyllum amplum TaxID=97359 RepID=A0A550CTJ0_9AGAR|nr:P-loop containing nucleoside triphosphate hydrolase protein [Auriculariopsis ampla]